MIVERFKDITTILLNHVEKMKTRVVLIDLSAAIIDDNEVAKQLAKTIRTVRLLGADCIIADMPANLARAMEPMLPDLGSLKSYNCMNIALEEALKMIGYEIREKALEPGGMNIG